MTGEKMCAVERVEYVEWEKRGQPEAPKTVRVIYHLDHGGKVSEWVCPEHVGFALEKFQRWWAERTECSAPTDARSAARFGDHGGLRTPSHVITVPDGDGGRFEKISGYVWPEQAEAPEEPEAPEAPQEEAAPTLDESVPF